MQEMSSRLDEFESALLALNRVRAGELLETAAVKTCIARAGPGGGYPLADNHGEIPWQVPDDVLFAIAEAAQVWGRYPLDWMADYEN